MIFVIQEPNRYVHHQENIPRPCVILRKDNWNDYSYFTLFQAFFLSEKQAEPIELGSLKIMRLGQETGERTFSDETLKFNSLQELKGEFCSLGNELNYYKKLSILDEKISVEILESLCDASFNENIRWRFEKDSCFQISLLRDMSSVEALDKGGSFFGKAVKRRIKFNASINITEGKKSHDLSFNFEEYKGLPHRVNLLVGTNGVGKTQIMAKLAILLSKFTEEWNVKELSNKLKEAGNLDPRPSLYNIVAISFNVFDSFELPSVKDSESFKYSYCGLRKDHGGIRDENEIVAKITELIFSLDEEKRNLINKIWPRIINFEDAPLIDETSKENFKNYSKYSAGQRIVINIVSHIIANIRSQSLLLIDEPETHLHPKLMTTLYLIIVELLELYDSFAIIATHSPIIVQQTPSKYIQVIKRIENEPIVTRPVIECFGENLTEISRNVFQAVESDRDYEQVIDRLLKENYNDVEMVRAIFDGQLGMNAQIYLGSKAANIE